MTLRYPGRTVRGRPFALTARRGLPEGPPGLAECAVPDRSSCDRHPQVLAVLRHGIMRKSSSRTQSPRALAADGVYGPYTVKALGGRPAATSKHRPQPGPGAMQAGPVAPGRCITTVMVDDPAAGRFAAELNFTRTGRTAFAPSIGGLRRRHARRHSSPAADDMVFTADMAVYGHRTRWLARIPLSLRSPLRAAVQIYPQLRASRPPPTSTHCA